MPTKSTAPAISSLVNHGERDEGLAPSHSTPSSSSSDGESESESDDEPPPTHTLDDAISGATESRIRALLRQMCSSNATCRDLASRALLISADKGPTESTTNGSKKRSRKAFEMCCQCKEEFDVLENEAEKGLCVYHPGEKDVSDHKDFWDDHDDDCHGDPEDFKDEPGYGEGYMWTCCEEDGDAEGCRTTRHRSAVKTKRMRSG